MFEIKSNVFIDCIETKHLKSILNNFEEVYILFNIQFKHIIFDLGKSKKVLRQIWYNIRRWNAVLNEEFCAAYQT